MHCILNPVGLSFLLGYRSFSIVIPAKAGIQGHLFQEQDWGCAHGFPPSRE
jgi:hypothetical protein